MKLKKSSEQPEVKKTSGRRIAIFSDIHSNLEALEAVLEDIGKEKISRLVCLGDVVGYNANPCECLAKVRALGCPIMKGNHDHDAAGDSSLSDYRDLARLAMAYTREKLSGEEKFFLRGLPLVGVYEDTTLVHSSLFKPEEFPYVDSTLDAIYHFTSQMTALCFCGHTHVPKIYIQRGRAVEIHSPRCFRLEKEAAYLVNVGSVGQPRDRDWRASYVIYDPELHEIEFRRVEYDLLAAQEKINMVGLPTALAERLGMGI